MVSLILVFSAVAGRQNELHCVLFIDTFLLMVRMIIVDGPRPIQLLGQ